MGLSWSERRDLYYESIATLETTGEGDLEAIFSEAGELFDAHYLDGSEYSFVADLVASVQRKRHESHPLWVAFLEELDDHDAWDSNFQSSPYSPSEAMERFVRGGDAARTPNLVAALNGTDERVRYWAIVGLEWMGPAAAPVGTLALIAYIDGGGDLLRRAAVALEAIDPASLRHTGVHRNPSVMEDLVTFHLRRGVEDAVEFAIAWAAEPEVDLEPLLSHHGLRAALVEHTPPQARAWLQELSTVDARAASLLAELGGFETESLIRSMRGGLPGIGAIESVAYHPASVALVDVIVEHRNTYILADLLKRRRAAGLSTPPEAMRELLREKLERPERPWRYEQHDVHQAALCAAELGDEALLDSLVLAVDPQNTGFAWAPLLRALRVLGPNAREAVEQARDRTTPERAEVLQWMADQLAVPLPDLRTQLELADATFLRGRVEGSVVGAFTDYANTLLTAPSFHAAFQLAWIDRAFGCEILPERLQWLQTFGCRDATLLDELARPVDEPLRGWRTSWDPGEFGKFEADRAVAAAAAGLWSLAAHWLRGDEGYAERGRHHVERVRNAASLSTFPATD